MRFIAATLLCVLAFQAQAETKFYKCTDQWGQPVFSQRPCGGDAKEGSVEAHGMTGSVRSDFSTINASNEIRDKEREIDRLEDKVERLARIRDNKLAQLKARTRSANNNLAGAQYHESLATEMQSVNSQYQSKIDIEQGRIARLYSGIKKLEVKEN